MPFPDHLVYWPAPGVRRTIRLTTKVTHLPTGDYALGSAPDHTIIERKANLTELHGNLVNPLGRGRFYDELKRLRDECSNPVLFLEGSPASLMAQVRQEVDPDRVRSLLMEACSRFRVSLLVLPTATIHQRRQAGEWLASLLVAGGSHASDS